VSDQRVWWDIWEQPDLAFPWCMQAINFVAHFKTKEEAETWRDAVLKVQKEKGLKS